MAYQTGNHTLNSSSIGNGFYYGISIVVNRRDSGATGSLGYKSGGDLEMAMRWYVIHTYPGSESQVKEFLLNRIKVSGVESFFGEIMVPTEEVVEIRAGQ